MPQSVATWSGIPLAPRPAAGLSLARDTSNPRPRMAGAPVLPLVGYSAKVLAVSIVNGCGHSDASKVSVSVMRLSKSTCSGLRRHPRRTALARRRVGLPTTSCGWTGQGNSQSVDIALTAIPVAGWRCRQPSPMRAFLRCLFTRTNTRRTAPPGGWSRTELTRYGRTQPDALMRLDATSMSSR